LGIFGYRFLKPCALRSNGKFIKEVTQMKKLITLTMVLALAAAFTTGCKKAEAPKPATPAVEPAKPVQAPMSAKKADAKPADAKPADAKPAAAKPADKK